MSFKESKPYPKYKDSGAEWLGEIPEHWRVMPFFTQAQERKETNKGMLESNLLSLSYGRIVPKDINTHEGLLPESFESYQIVHPDDIVFRLTDLQNDKRSLRSAICKELGIITSAYLVVRTQVLDSNYLNYLMRSYDVMKVFYSMGGGMRQSMKFDDLKRLPLIAPPTLEQSAIASFLDHETSRIDSLISEKERLISLLQEYRQALISHAVTKGLNPNVKMKDSGVEWLGEIPEHWEIVPVKGVATCNDDVLEETTDEDFEIEYVEISGVDAYRGIVDTTVLPFGKAPSRARRRIQKGDILVSTVRTYLRAIASVHQPPDNMIASTGFAVIRPRSIESAFLGYLFHAEYIMAEIIARSVGVSYPAINANELMRLTIPLPLAPEQISIASFLDREASRIDTLISGARKFIDLLKEYRSSLITAAVIGKIDVRGYHV